jgi:hypothetical protein
MVIKREGHYQNNFTKGEFAPSLWGHVDLNGYYEGLAFVENVWITGSGYAVKRYGLVRVHTDGNTGYARMFPCDNASGRHWLMLTRGAA